ncbi:AAA family ATPase [Deinococcus sp. VB142]|uniref:AAA family ATPase n=1 Tax=Deinococcus sp. VB142 TaxID=3112952 RepID=A0AAU6Q0H6_9DEIO
MGHLFHLIGPPGSGKRTVGLALSRLTGAALMDNHLINDPIFTAWGADGHKPLPPEIWAFTRRVREIVLEAVAAAPAEVSHIFTNYLADLPGEAEFIDRFAALARERGARFVPVYLTCPTEELRRRMPLPERRARLKLSDPARLQATLDENGVLPVPDGMLTLDTSQMTPEQAARAILTFAEAQVA